jgi:D-arabinose 1-dehydrogenase-like Zn-dependent alcohol dehydrogenase
MRAVMFDEFGVMPEVRTVPDPRPPAGGVVIRVRASGLCRSDWHGWRGHDPDVRLPHVPGHEFAGEIAALGAGVAGWRVGDRVTAPFVCGCGHCPTCLAGDPQVCPAQTQPGFTHWGSFAEYVVVHDAMANLVALPDGLDFPAAAALGCRFATAYRAVVQQGRVAPGEWVAVYGCGGVGLSAVMIAAAAGARVVAVDVSPAALELAARCGAEVCLDAGTDHPDGDPTATAVREATGGGAALTLDALGSPRTCLSAIASLRRRGRHVQVGLLPPAEGRPVLPMELIIGHELEVLGSHGLATHAYPRLLELVGTGALRPQALVTGMIPLTAVPEALAGLDRPAGPGIRVALP